MVGQSLCLEELRLSDCRSLASDEAAAKLARSLKDSAAGATLQRLSLSRMCPTVVGPPARPIVARPGIGKEGLEALLESVDAAPQLQQLEVTLGSRSGVPQPTIEQLRAHRKILVDQF